MTIKGGCAGETNISCPNKPDSGFVVNNKRTLKNPLRPKIAEEVNVAAPEVWCTPSFLACCTKVIQRMMLRGMILTQYAKGYLDNILSTTINKTET
jgi:hypothetical protein